MTEDRLWNHAVVVANQDAPIELAFPRNDKFKRERDRQFESALLQRRVKYEPDLGAHPTTGIDVKPAKMLPCCNRRPAAARPRGPLRERAVSGA